MTLHLSSRRVLGTAPTILKTIRPTLVAPTARTTLTLALRPAQARHASSSTAAPAKGVTTTATNHETKLASAPEAPKGPQPDENKEQARATSAALREEKRAAAKRENAQDALRKAMIKAPFESPSIFDDDVQAIAEALADKKAAAAADEDTIARSAMGASLVTDHMRNAVDPDPRSRQRWERKMVIRHVKRCLDVNGRETKAERIKRTEREVLSKSSWLPTSYKKLMHLARQISGKTYDEAKTQMQFSKKKYAKEVSYELDLARDTGVVERGMGLGKVNGEFVPGSTETKTIRDHRHGKWVKVTDPTRLYVHEAWVNRGPIRAIKPNYRARGRVDRIERPSASITIRLKEEKTRVRLHEEKKAKEYRQGPWVHLPNRPVTAQRPFYSW